MSTQSDRLGLTKPTTSDPFNTGDISDNWQKIDDHPGIFICDHAGRPSDWGVDHEGMLIQENDSGLLFRWNGSAFDRVAPLGTLNRGTRTSDFQTTNTSAQVVVQTSAFVPNPGAAENLFVKITISYPLLSSLGGRCALSITGGSPSTLDYEWEVAGLTGATDAQDLGSGGTFTVYDQPFGNDGSGLVTYALNARALAGYTGELTMVGSADAPIAITVSEE